MSFRTTLVVLCAFSAAALAVPAHATSANFQMSCAFGFPATLVTCAGDPSKPTGSPSSCGTSSFTGTLMSERSAFAARAGSVLEIPDLVLRRGAVVEGMVATAAGEPASGSRVRWTGCGTDYLPCRESLAGADGSYRLEGLPEGPRSIVAEHPDHPRASSRIDVRPGVNHLDLQVGDGYPVSGIVTDPAGRPIEGAELTLSAAAGEHLSESATDGSFRWAGIANGTYTLAASKPGYAAARAVQIVVDGAPRSGIGVRLDTGGAISGRILGLDFEDLALVRVVAVGGGALSPVTGVLGYDGAYRVDNLGPGAWSVAATVAGSGRTREGGVGLSADAGEAHLDLDFGRGFSFTGQVLVGGKVPSTAEVELQSLGSVRFFGSSPVDAGGRFRLGGVPPGFYSLQVVAAGAQPLQQRLDLEADDDQTFDLSPAAHSSPNRP